MRLMNCMIKIYEFCCRGDPWERERGPLSMIREKGERRLDGGQEEI